MDLLRDAGGFQTTLILFGSYLVSIISKRLLNAEMMR